jgi:peptide/nickel transport system substrate-binding protein
VKQSKILLVMIVLFATVLWLSSCGQPAEELPSEETPAADSSSAEDEGGATADTDADSAETDTDTTTTSGASSPQQGGTLRVAFAEWPKNLHAQIDSGTEGLYVQVNITDGLVNVDGNGNVVPGLATELPEQPDPVTYIFHLREGVKFHNGTDFDAEDVLWTFDRLMGKIEGQSSTQAARFSAAIESVEALDDYTVKFTLTKPWDDFIPMMAADKYMDILSKEAFDELGDEYGLEGVVGTGPFQFKEWISGERIVIERFDDYWGEPAYVDEIVYRAIPEEATRQIALQTGEIDVLLDPSIRSVEEMRADPSLQVVSCDSGDEKVFYLNTTQPPFDDKQVRQAIFYAIDRQAVMDAVYYGLAPAGQGIFPPWHWAYDPDANFYPYDPEMAKAMLAEAGYTADNPLEFEIVTTEATEYLDTAVLIQAQLAEIGVKTTVSYMDKAAWVAKTWPTGGTANPAFQASVYRLKFGVPTTDFSWRIYHSDTSLNLFGYNQPGGYENPEMNQMLDDAWVITDRDEAVAAYREISRQLSDDALLLVLGWLQNVNVATDEVHGLGCWVRDDFPMNEVWLSQ